LDKPTKARFIAQKVKKPHGLVRWGFLFAVTGGQEERHGGRG